MFVRRGTPVESLLVGGSHERRRRAGTENVAGIVGLGRATELAMKSLADGTMDRVAALRDRLEAGILALPGTGLNGALADGTPAPRAANTTNIWFDNLEGEALVIALDLKGVAVSGGSACHSGATEPSHVLMAMGVDKNARPRQPALQPAENRDRGRDRPRAGDCARGCGAPAGDFAGCGGNAGLALAAFSL